MKKAIQFGAGNIGRGFIGQLFSQSGYEVVFADVNTLLIDALNKEKKYPIRVVSNARSHEIIIEQVRAVNSNDTSRVGDEIAGADIIATAVGVNVFRQLAYPISEGLKLRWQRKNFEPINIIICENLIDANKILSELVRKALPAEEQALMDSLVGFVESSIGRMVPVMTAEMQEGNILRIWVEEYAQLPVDKDGFKGVIPGIMNLVPFSPFGFYIKRKLYIHNMGHALTAYLGSLKGYTCIWQAIEDDTIRHSCRGAMMESARALEKEYGIPMEKLEEHVDDLISRFGNRQLGDTVERVGRDILRKLAPNDRMIGALNNCLKWGIYPDYICRGIAAALRFTDTTEEGGIDQWTVKPEEKLQNICLLEQGSREYLNIMQDYNSFGQE
jgi:mannitol-1-phosphate 5-dehydrogenase